MDGWMDDAESKGWQKVESGKPGRMDGNGQIKERSDTCQIQVAMIPNASMSLAKSNKCMAPISNDQSN
eukprot:scaffold629200_cov19-Prasinocladus_malaysianus.AAC.1